VENDGKEMVAEVGEIREGRWKSFESARVERREGKLRIPVPSRQALSLIILSGPEGMPGARRALERAMLRPDLLE
jgi:hypothetical protein